MTRVPLSVLDLATVEESGDIAAALQHSVDLARSAEQFGYDRVWYAEHHNMSAIASSATAVLIAHVAAHTERIRLGAGGVMLPNHSPLVIAEQFGMLAELHPGRIDLGLGRAPGSDMATFRAMRRSHSAAETFPADVRELQQLLSDELPRTAVNAYPGRYVGSSLIARLTTSHRAGPLIGHFCQSEDQPFNVVHVQLTGIEKGIHEAEPEDDQVGSVDPAFPARNEEIGAASGINGESSFGEVVERVRHEALEDAQSALVGATDRLPRVGDAEA